MEPIISNIENKSTISKSVKQTKHIDSMPYNEKGKPFC